MRPLPKKKNEPKPPAERRILPMELRVGDRLTDEAGEYAVIGRPYTIFGGKNPASAFRKWARLRPMSYGPGARTSGSA